MSYRSSPSFAVGGAEPRLRYRYYYNTPPGWSIDDMACRYDPKLDSVEVGIDAGRGRFLAFGEPNHFRLVPKRPRD